MDLLSQHEAFLRAIFDAPDDDTPRLVYADFLQENGEEDRAELIRTACELWRLHGPEGTGARARELEKRLAAVTQRLPRTAAQQVRGFRPAWKVMTLSLDQLMSTDLRGHTVHSCPECFAIEGLKVCAGRIATAEPFDVAFSLPAFARVTELDLEGNEVEEEKADDSPFTPFRLEPVISVAGVEALARHRGARKLTSLLLRNNNLDNDAARALIKSPYLDNLKRLDLLEGNRLRGKVWQQVIERFGEDVAG